MQGMWRGAALGSPFGLHTLYLLYTQIVVLLAALPMIWAYASGRWFWLAAIWAVVLVLSWFPGVIRHARSPIVRACRDPDYSYARRPGGPSTGGTAEPAPCSRIP
ncbi:MULTISPECIES: hypothetical protein [Stenotrophomonas]|uniref:hypothetical protein n=1 Tax=Stenotrophomonas TaxID=40323 RepID=UPI000B02C7BF|nr:hypothetical protein [Stenotrophomonas maltophilia]